MSDRLADIPVVPTGADQVAMAYRAFDHWLKHEHVECGHESLNECAEEYTEGDHEI